MILNFIYRENVEKQSIQQRSQPSIPEYDEVLWSTPITMAGLSTSRASASQISFSQMDENLVHIAEDSEKNIKEIFNESEIEMQVPEDTDDIDSEDTDDINSENTDDINSEDLQEALLDDALDTIEGKNVPKHIAEWPNPDVLFFGINGCQMTFAARISFFLADMLEADDVTATYKGAKLSAIRKYGALNGLSIETYETLHKSYVKNPYRSSNRKNVMQQLVNAVKRKELTPSDRKLIHRKAEDFGKVLWELSLDCIDQKLESWKKNENKLHSNFIEGLSQIITTLDIFLDTSLQKSKNDKFYIKIYDSKIKINIAPIKEPGTEKPLKKLYELALVRWYDIKIMESELYGCPQLYYTKEYNTIPIGSINTEVHIILRFGKENYYLLNKYMF
ncbi:hypothetical protein C1646_765025 [Rhizophagus diaphanus]|nr:hypothetical protein C1646_765025 [Rhizophagus diaphanus] [Rhizophagus sp. MUCL 43196]